MSAVVQIEQFQDGSLVTKSWRRFSDRLPEFLAMFPPSKGWRVEHTARPACEAASGLMQAYCAAITAGVKPADVGLPAVPTGWIHEARLVSPDGATVASGSAVGLGVDLAHAARVAEHGGYVDRQRDFEAAATAAYQRLLAAVGLSGEVLDDDEDVTIRSATARSAAAKAVKQPTATPAPAASATPAQADAAPTVRAIPATPKAGRNTVLPTAAPAPATGNTDDAALRATRRQVERIAKQLGVTPAATDTLDAAEAELERLSQLIQGGARG